MNAAVPLRSYDIRIERLGWAMVVLGMLSQLSAENALPTYNIVLGEILFFRDGQVRILHRNVGFWSLYVAQTTQINIVYG